MKDIYSKISSESLSNYDAFILCDNTEGNFRNNISNLNYFPFTTDKLARLPYPGKSANGNLTSVDEADWHHKRFNFDPGNVELPVLYFFGQNPEYDHYWVVEYDVRFSGAWRDFFTANAESSADLLGTTLTRRTDVEDWYHWSSLRLGDR